MNIRPPSYVDKRIRKFIGRALYAGSFQSTMIFLDRTQSAHTAIRTFTRLADHYRVRRHLAVHVFVERSHLYISVAPLNEFTQGL